MKLTETIAAIASAGDHSGIGIIRISGDEAIKIVDKIFKSKNEEKKLLNVKSHTVHFGKIVDGEKEMDEVLVLVFRSPHSFTGENTVEIDCHGGALVLKKIFDLVVKNGAKVAQPGEFTKRAFLNGKMDLSQAEAVADIVNAQNDFALESSISQLQGKVSNRIKEIRGEILYYTSFIESALDDPEHISVDGHKEEIRTMIDKNIKKIKDLLDTFQTGHKMKEGIRTVIMGKPNVGKSSLLNLLLGKERAIVTEIEGTTRDILEETVYLGELSLTIIDTAGIRDTKDIVEKIGVDKAKHMAQRADLIIFVIDGSKEVDENDRKIFRMIKEKQAIILINKTDLRTIVTPEKIKSLTDQDIILFSAKEGEGLLLLKQKIKEMFYGEKISFNHQVYITNSRHKEALDQALSSLEQVKKSMEENMPEDFYSIDLMEAYASLGLILGESVEDDLVDEIFSKFCMGK